MVVLADPGSGASPLGRAFAQLGAREAGELAEIGGELLAAVGSAWDDVLEIAPGWLSKPEVVELGDRAKRVLRDDRPGADVLVLDDRRMCRLVPFWIDVIEGGGVDPRLVLAFRSPLEVAPLLRTQHGVPEQLANILWLRYLVDAERDSRGHRRCFVAYEDIAADPAAAIDKLATALELPLGPRTEAVDRSLESLLVRPAGDDDRHPPAGQGGGEVQAWARSAYAGFVDAAGGGAESTLVATLDRIARDLDQQLGPVAPTIRAQRERAEAVEQHLERARDDLRRIRVQQTERERAIAATETQLADLIGSRSWRLTAPLRWATRALHRLRYGSSELSPYLKAAARAGDFSAADSARYQAWAARHDTPDAKSRRELERRLERLTRTPLITVVMATFETEEEHLREAIASVRRQVYPNWELCIADDASTSADVRRILDEAARADERIKVTYREQNGHISAACNSALALASGEFVAFLDHDDVLSDHALAEVALELDAHPDALFVYSDEDRLDTQGGRCEPYFKPDWNPELLFSNNYLCHLSVARRDLVERVGGFREGFEGSQDYDLFLRVTADLDDPARIRHIPRILYHWRKHAGSTAGELGAKPYAPIAGRRALSDRFAGEGVEIEHAAVPTFYRVRYPIPEPPPTVSLIIPTKDGGDLLVQCVESILTTTSYRAYELIVVDNGSRNRDTRAFLAELSGRPQCRVLTYEERFNFSAINNFAVREASGELVGFVNDDIEVQNAEWLEEMVSHAARPEIGAVGAKLLYPDGRVQHGGIVLGIGGVAGHMHKGWPGSDPGYFGRLISVQAVSAVTGACMLVSKSKFEEVGGLDEENLAIAFNDVELCLRLREAGYRNVWTPHAVLWHAESASRGYEDTEAKLKRFSAEAAYITRHWKRQLLADPYYNPNLSLLSEGFEVAGTPRI